MALYYIYTPLYSFILYIGVYITYNIYYNTMALYYIYIHLYQFIYII